MHHKHTTQQSISIKLEGREQKDEERDNQSLYLNQQNWNSRIHNSQRRGSNQQTINNTNTTNETQSPNFAVE